MHYNNTVNSNIKVTITIIIAMIISSCIQKEKRENGDQHIDQIKCDSIVYALPEITTDTLAGLLKDKNISRCNLLKSEKDTYYFSFGYDDRTSYSKRDSILFQKTNTFLKVKNKYYPVITTFDNLFVDIPRENGVFINEFNFCSIEVDAKGNIVSVLEF